MNKSLSQLFNKTRTLKSLKSIHAHLITNGCINSSDFALNKLLRAYSRFGSIDHARKVFDEIPQPNEYLWTAIIHGYIENDKCTEALCMFNYMLYESVCPLNFTIAAVLKGLMGEKRVRDGEGVYGVMFKLGLDFDLIVQNSFVDFFMKCGEVSFASRIFDETEEKDVVSWNSMITGYGSNGQVDVARDSFDKMPERTPVSWTGMIQGYIKVGNLAEANALFGRMPMKDLASWNVMVSGFIGAGDLVGARSVFEEMPFRDSGTWNLLISGFCKAGNIETATELFDKMPDKNVMSWTMMVDGLIKSGDVNAAKSLFDRMPKKNLISWSTMIGGYAKNGQPHNALKLYHEFKKQGIKPDETFMLAVISACSQLGILDAAESVINDFTTRPNFSSSFRLITSLIDMYAKCGSIERAMQVFQKAHPKDLLCYSTMISAFANHGLGQQAINLFSEMQKANIKPDGITFLAVLSACNHAGLVDEGRKHFKQMTDEYKIQPTEKHYACVVDLLGRVGCLNKAHDLIGEMTVTPTAVVWGALLAACRVHRNVELAEVAASELFKIEPENSGNYVLLSNIYASASRWDAVAKVRAMMREHRVKKNKASSWIELGCKVHEFVMGDISHSETENVYLILEVIKEDMKLLECSTN
ncbi:hypothetical protein ACFE04_011760 [Oxalis oulophora]